MTEKNRSGPQMSKLLPGCPNLTICPNNFSRSNPRAPICSVHLPVNRMKCYSTTGMATSSDTMNIQTSIPRITQVHFVSFPETELKSIFSASSPRHVVMSRILLLPVWTMSRWSSKQIQRTAVKILDAVMEKKSLDEIIDGEAYVLVAV